MSREQQMSNALFYYEYKVNITKPSVNPTASTAEFIHRSVFTIYIIFGIIGNVFNILIFTSRVIARTSVSLYLLSASIGNLFVTGFVLPFRLSVDGFMHDITSTSLLVCKFVSYIYYVCLGLPPFFTVLACADRWAASCVQINRRRFAHVRIAKRFIPATIILCCLLYSHIFATFVHDNNPPPPYCSVDDYYAIFVLSFHLIIYSLIPPFLMALFSVFIIYNIRRKQSRITPVIWVMSTSGNHGKIRQNRHRISPMQIMLICQGIFECTLTLPFSVINLVSMIVKNDDYFLTIYSFLRLIIFFNYVSSFYVYTLSSKLYRNELKRVAKSLCKWQ